MWPSRGRSHSSGRGQWRASHSPCATGTTRSSPPCTTSTGTSMSRHREAPGAGEGDVVVDQPVRPGGARAPGVGAERLPLARQRRVVGGREAVLVERGRLGVPRACGATGARRPQAAGRDHAGEPVEVLRARREAAEARRGGDPAGQQRRAGEGVRPAARRAHHREARDAGRVGELRHVGRRVGDGPAGPRARAAVARPPVGQHPEAALRGRRHQRQRGDAGLGRAVVPHHGEVRRRPCRTCAACARREGGRLAGSAAPGSSRTMPTGPSLDGN